MQGQKDVPLNEQGRQQTVLTAEYVRQHFDPDAIWASDLSRCADMAEAIGQGFKTSELLREINFGSWEGKTWDEVPVEERAVAGAGGWDPHFRPPGGESRADLVTRAQQFMEESRIGEIDGDIVISGHGGSMAGMVVHLLGLPVEATYKFKFGNASISTVDVTPDLTMMTTFSAAMHLEDLERA